MSQSSDLRLQDKTILVTGASDGLGKAIALRCAAEGATVILVAKNAESLADVYDQIEAMGAPQAAILAINFETAAPVDYQSLANVVEEEFGHLDGLVINAAWLGQTSSISQYDIENWFKVMQINLNSPFMLSRMLLPLLNKSADASIVFTLDDKTTAYWGAYGVSKAGLEGYMKILADELDTDTIPIRVNGVKPPAMRTKLRMRAYPGEDPNERPLPDELTEQYVEIMQGKYPHGEIIKI